MRILLSSTAGAGHFGPLVAIGHACRRAGHEVAVAAPAGFASHVSGAGLDHAPFGEPDREELERVFATLPQLAGLEADRMVIAEVFGRLDAQAALPGVTGTIADWHPDLVLRDPCEFGSLVAAVAAGVPQAQVAIGMSRLGRGIAALLTGPLQELAELSGTDAAQLTAQVSSVTLTMVPPSLDGPDFDRREPDHDTPVLRYSEPAGTADGSLPAAWGRGDDPLVYVTFGSVTGGLPHLRRLYAEAAAGLADLQCRALITTGHGLDPAELGPLPSNVHAVPWWPQQQVMPLAAAVVGHGGFGTTMLAAAAGVPQVVLPLFSFDQTVHAERIVAVGAGIHVAGGVDAARELEPAVDRVLRDPRFATAARAVAAEMAAQPDLDALVASLPQIADAPD